MPYPCLKHKAFFSTDRSKLHYYTWEEGGGGIFVQPFPASALCFLHSDVLVCLFPQLAPPPHLLSSFSRPCVPQKQRKAHTPHKGRITGTRLKTALHALLLLLKLRPTPSFLFPSGVSIRRSPGFPLALALKGAVPTPAFQGRGRPLPSRAAWPGAEPRPACRALEGRVWETVRGCAERENSASRAVRTAAAASKAALLSAQPLFFFFPHGAAGCAWTATRELSSGAVFRMCVCRARVYETNTPGR